MIQVDVWRTKYLATSLLVTELATVKAELMKKCDDFEKAVEGSRKERAEITDKIFKVGPYLTVSKHIYDLYCKCYRINQLYNTIVVSGVSE